MKALALLLMLAAASAAAADCADTSVDIRLVGGGSVHFRVELAADPASRAQGLMFRTEMPRSSGMLFLYERPQRSSFWMKNTLIPLDMIFADETGLVTAVHSNAIPHDETPIEGGDAVLMVLEINAGLSERLGISPGAVMRHPGLAQTSALWACDAQ